MELISWFLSGSLVTHFGLPNVVGKSFLSDHEVSMDSLYIAASNPGTMNPFFNFFSVQSSVGDHQTFSAIKDFVNSSYF